MPLYGHEVVYSKTFEVPVEKKTYQVELGKWKGTVALLKVNDRQVAILTGNEHSYDISGYTHQGSNKVELIVTGSLKNTLGPHYYKPAPGMVSPWHWRYIYKRIPGNEYDLYDYGLLEEFRVIQY